MDKVEEESILERFKDKFHQFPVGEVRHDDKPDFIIEGHLKVGIEITQVFKDQDFPQGSNLKSKERFCRNVLKDVTTHLKSIDFPKCVFSISINDSIYSRQIDSREVSRACVNHIRDTFQSIPQVGDYTIENIGDLPEIINCYDLTFIKSLDEIEFVETGSGVGNELDNSYIQFILDKKEEAKRKYELCDQYWLIIKEGSFEADYFGPVNIDRQALRTSFDKVFIIRQSGSEIIDLK